MPRSNLFSAEFHEKQADEKSEVHVLIFETSRRGRDKVIERNFRHYSECEEAQSVFFHISCVEISLDRKSVV